MILSIAVVENPPCIYLGNNDGDQAVSIILDSSWLPGGWIEQVEKSLWAGRLGSWGYLSPAGEMVLRVGLG